MFIKSDIENKLDAEILSLLAKLKETTKDSNDYEKMIERVSKLHTLKTNERSKQISPDTVLVVIANIVGIMWLARYEKENVISGKALNFVMKPR